MKKDESNVEMWPDVFTGAWNSEDESLHHF